MADILTIVSVISFILAGVFAILAIALWFLLKISIVIGDLSGRTARKSIELMRQNNEKTGNKSFQLKEQRIEKINRQGFDETGLLYENMVQEQYSQATGLLINDSTVGLNDLAETSPLIDTEKMMQRKAAMVSVNLLEEVIFIHTDEVI